MSLFFFSRMTEEEREKAQEQMAALTQAYSELSQHCSDQTTAVEEVRPPVKCLSYQLENSATCWTGCMTNRFLLLCNELSFAASVFFLDRSKHMIYNIYTHSSML